MPLLKTVARLALLACLISPLAYGAHRSVFFLGVTTGVDITDGSTNAHISGASSPPATSSISRPAFELGINAGAMRAINPSIAIGLEASLNLLGGVWLTAQDSQVPDAGLNYSTLMGAINYYPNQGNLFLFGKVGVAYLYNSAPILGANVTQLSKKYVPAAAVGIGTTYKFFAFTLEYQRLAIGSLDFKSQDDSISTTTYTGHFEGSLNSFIVGIYWYF